MVTALVHVSIACKQLYVHVSTDHSFLHSASHLGVVGTEQAAVTVTNKERARTQI